jgi:hypothetical protein
MEDEESTTPPREFLERPSEKRESRTEIAPQVREKKWHDKKILWLFLVVVFAYIAIFVYVIYSFFANKEDELTFTGNLAGSLSSRGLTRRADDGSTETLEMPPLNWYVLILTVTLGK